MLSMSPLVSAKYALGVSAASAGDGWVGVGVVLAPSLFSWRISAT